METTLRSRGESQQARRWVTAAGAAVFLVVLAFGPLIEHSALERAFTSALYIALGLFLVALSGRFAFGLAAAGLLTLVLEAAAHLKYKYLTTPLLAPDIVYMVNADTLRTMSRYPLLVGAALAAVLCVPLLLGLAWRLERAPSFAHRRRPWLARALLAAFALLSAGEAMSTTGPFAEVHAKGMWLAMTDASLITDFLISFRATTVQAPAYPTQAADAFDWKRADADAGAALHPRPDIVAVLEESTFDPRIMAACTLRLCDRRMFHADRRTLAHGLLDVHTWGGGTWTSEFSFLTGLSHEEFGPAGLYAPFNLAPRIRYTLPRALRANGYRTVAIYPTDGDFLNGRNAYADYGFDAFYGGEQVGLGWDSTDADLLRVFERVYADEKAKANGQPVFLFMLTLHQHGPHMTPYAKLRPPYDRPLFTGKMDDWQNLNLTNYLERLDQSDRAIARLEGLLRAGGKPVLMVHFGDHQPSFDGAINGIAKRLPAGIPDPTRVTYYMLKGYATPLHRYDYPVLDLAFLGSLVLDAADLHKDAFFTANALLRERCKGHYLDCDAHALMDSYRADVFGQLQDLGE
ncbi:MAG: sulfatase-like hydrolase/transferase [Mizugakiibacter sp.]|uniref:sulfatase-like hydrolase/transferase n=1 Tax=Mizugakiibacter sp. TaxID=1972610 RepID=UPI0031CA02E0|nr:sulfatase-like hydrolase/transferase [Xanthomonadaceae bacterium]